MAIFNSISEGWRLFKDSFKVLFRKPIFLLPITISWIVFAGVVLYFRYYFTFPNSLALGFLYFYLLLFLITYVISLMNLLMLELMQQIESGEKISLSKALKEFFSWNFFAVIPLALFWAFIWFIILIIQILTSKSKNKEREEPSIRDSARALGGAENGPFSWLKFGLRIFEKLLRMSVFLALPAIAWENKSSFSAFRKSIEIIKKHPIQFLTTYTLTGFTVILMALPLVPVFLLDDFGFTFSTTFWLVVIIYECIIWSLSIYLEQMSIGLLYLWHLKWEKNGSKGDLSSVPKPDLLDEFYELK
jgi:hypothetical protein